MFRSRLIATTLFFAVAIAPAAIAAPIAVSDLERLQGIAQQEGLPIKTIRAAGPKRLSIRTEEGLDRAAFIKRASLIAYFVFHRMPSAIEAIAFENDQGEAVQSCVIKSADHTLYLQDRITKVEYEKRLSYRQTADAPAAVAHLPAIPSAPTAPTLPLPKAPVGQVAPVSQPAAAVAPAVQSRVAITPARALTSFVGVGWGLGVAGGRYDAFMLEYGNPLLPTLDLRPSMQIVSPFSPLNAFTAQPRQGLSVACDLMGTTRQQPNAWGFSFEGGLGARVGTWQGAGLEGPWPAMHLRLGMRWQALTLGMRYPLLQRGNDPAGGWEANLGVSMPIGSLLGR